MKINEAVRAYLEEFSYIDVHNDLLSEDDILHLIDYLRDHVTDNHEHIWTGRTIARETVAGWDIDGPILNDESIIQPDRCLACGQTRL